MGSTSGTASSTNTQTKTHLSDGVYVAGFPREAGCDEVHTMLHTELEVCDVLVRHRRQVDLARRAGKTTNKF